MFELFRNLPSASLNRVVPVQWNYIQKGMRNNLYKVQQYYKVYNPTLRSNHFLVRLLQSLAVPMSLSLDRYYENVDSIALGHSMVMRMHSSIYDGEVFRGVFYGNQTPEILIANDDIFDFIDVHENWRNVSAVNVIQHGKTDLGIHLPNGESYSDETGVTVISINIAMLAVQYRAFVLEQATKNSDSHKTIMQFIAGYVLTNMLPSQLEISFFNRLYQRAYGLESYTALPYRKHSFGLTSFDTQVDYVLDKVLDTLSKSRKEFTAILANCPAFLASDMHRVLRMPDIAPTSQIDYILVLSRLKAVDFLIRTCSGAPETSNQSHLNQMSHALRTNNVIGSIKTKMPTDIQRELNIYLEYFEQRGIF